VAEAAARRERVVVLGAGPVGRAIAALAHRCAFEVVLCGTPADVPGPWASVASSPPRLSEVAGALGGLGAGDALLIVTRDHAVDQRLVEELRAGVPGVDADALALAGMIGGRAKLARLRAHLDARGLLAGEGAARGARLRAPVGLDLGAETPDEIAVAVVAQLVALRRRGAPEAGAWAPRPPGSDDAVSVKAPRRGSC
jgi:xanthine dehydrogenase accessory factor